MGYRQAVRKFFLDGLAIKVRAELERASSDAERAFLSAAADSIEAASNTLKRD